MKLDCPRKEFHEAAAMCNIAASGRSPLPFLMNLKLEATEEGLRLLGCDGEMWIERTVPCMVHEPGAVCVASKLLVDLLASLPDGDLSLEAEEGQGMVLQQGASEYRMLVQDPEDFPEIPEIVEEGRLALPMNVLRNAVDSVLFAVASDTHRQILTGVLFSYDGTSLTLVATDTHRLALRKIEKEGIGTELNHVLPEKALKVLKALPIADTEDVAIRFAERRLAVDTPTTRLVSQLIEGTFPAFERVIPAESTRTWTAEIDQMGEKVKRAMILARDNAFRVRFKGEGDQIVLHAKSEEKGEAKEEVPMVATGGELEIAFNGTYVMDVLNALGAMGSAGVRIELTESARPAVFRSADDGEGYLCVVMPMSLV